MITLLFKIWHWVIHKLNLSCYSGRVISWHDSGKVFVAFRCDCGYIDRKSVTCADKMIDEDLTKYKEVNNE